MSTLKTLVSGFDRTATLTSGIGEGVAVAAGGGLAGIEWGTDVHDPPNVGTYWQPAVGLSEQDDVASLRQSIGRVAGVHCFSWWPGTERLPLEGRKDLWQAVSDVVR